MFAGPPRDPTEYHEVQVDGLKVYVPMKARVQPEGLKISMWGIGPWRRVLVRGLLA